MEQQMRYDPTRDLPSSITTGFYIGGEWQAPTSTATVPIISPIDQHIVVDMPAACPDDIDAAIDAARTAFDKGPWPSLSPNERAYLVGRLAQAVSDDLESFARAWTGQVGAPLALARKLVPLAPAVLRYYAELANSFPWNEPRSTLSGGARVVQEPVGVCAVIIPWNNPLSILAGKLAPALIAGCTVVVKPPLETPIEALLMAHHADRIGFPPGVINVVPGGRELGAHLVAHPDIDKVTFTGSTAAGKSIAAACAANMTRVSLELGGKSAAIILEDAPIDIVLGTIIPWSMPFSGQACLALTRLLVHRSRLKEITAAYTAAIGAMCAGDPWNESTQVGPVVNQAQMQRVLDYIAKGVEEGAKPVLGGGRDDRFPDGNYIQPTIFTDVTPDMTIAREEIFGPVVCIIPFDDDEEAIAIANNTAYGLHGSVFSADLVRAERVARRVQTGSIGLNTFNLDPATPFGGVKCSGIGREGGPEGLSAFLEPKAIFLREPVI